MLLESEKDRGVFGVREIFLLTYLYCLNGSVDKAEALAAANAAVDQQRFVSRLVMEKIGDRFRISSAS